MAEVENQNVQEQETVVQNAQTEEKEAVQETPELTAEELEIYNKISALAKVKKGKLYKSYLRDNDFKDEDVQRLSAKFYEADQKKESAEQERYSALQKKYDELNAKMFNMEMNKSAAKIASEAGMKEDKLEFVMKMADLSNVNNNGVLNEEALKTAITDVLDKIPEFKSAEEEEVKTVVTKVGADENHDNTDDGTDALRRAFGLK